MLRNYSRRNFLRNTLGAGVVIAGSQITDISAITSLPDNPYKTKGLATMTLGKTGVVIPRIAIGTGSRFCDIPTLDEAIGILTYALDNGLYYWDTANQYSNGKTGVISEERLGYIVKDRRSEIFLSTKLLQREPDKAKLELEQSLKRLRTDHVDMLKIHSINSLEDVADICKKGNILDVISKFKEEGITRFIGFSGHASAAALKVLVETGRFDSMLIAMNHWAGYKEDRESLVIPAARDKGMGIMLMKAVRPKETIQGIVPEDLIRFALSLKGAHGVVIGMDSMKVVKSNISILSDFKPMNEEEKLKYAMILSPFFKHKNLEWMKEDYRDGNWG